MAVDKSLSRGLADRVLTNFEDVAAQHLVSCARFGRQIPRKRHDVRRIANNLTTLGAHASLSQVLGNHPKWRWAVVAPFLPLPPGLGEDSKARNRATRYYLFPIHIHVNKPGLISTNPLPVLEVLEHAFERLFLRLNSTDAEKVKDEVHDALCLSPHLFAACRSLNLRQVVLPTKSGAFLCDLDAPAWIIRANTWIPYGTHESRREITATAIAECHEWLGGPRLLAEAIATLPYGENMERVESLEALKSVLQQFPWLQEKYQPGVDKEGETWRQARAQASNL